MTEELYKMLVIKLVDKTILEYRKAADMFFDSDFEKVKFIGLVSNNVLGNITFQNTDESKGVDAFKANADNAITNIKNWFEMAIADQEKELATKQ